MGRCLLPVLPHTRPRPWPHPGYSPATPLAAAAGWSPMVYLAAAIKSDTTGAQAQSVQPKCTVYNRDAEVCLGGWSWPAWLPFPRRLAPREGQPHVGHIQGRLQGRPVFLRKFCRPTHGLGRLHRRACQPGQFSPPKPVRQANPDPLWATSANSLLSHVHSSPPTAHSNQSCAHAGQLTVHSGQSETIPAKPRPLWTNTPWTKVGITCLMLVYM